MIRAARTAAAVMLVGGLLGLAVAAPAQSPLNDVAKKKLSEQSGIPLDMLATLVVNDGPDRFILAFVATKEAILDSELKAELKDGVRPFVDTPALLTLVYPTQASRFDPHQITFSQDNARFLTESSDINPLTDNFRTGQLPAEALSAGVIQLPTELDPTRVFDIVFRGAFSTTFQPNVNNSSDRSTRQTNAVIRQEGQTWTLAPLKTSRGLDGIYQYEDFRSRSSLIREDASILFLHEESDGTLSVVISHQSQRPAEVKFTLWGVPQNATFAIQDDSDDAYWLSPPSAKATWRWSSGQTDGAALSGLSDGTSLSLRPEFNGSVNTWYLVRGSLADPEYVALPSTSSPLQLEISKIDSSSSASDDDEDSSASDERDGTTSDLSAEIDVSPSQPVVGQTITLDASASEAPSSEIVSYAWDVDGDGDFEKRSSSASTSHEYRTTGTYQIQVKVTDNRDRTATASQTVDVQQASHPARVERVIGSYLPNSQALPGSSFHVRLKVKARRRIVGLGVRERPPENWQLTPVENAGAKFNRELTEWLFTDPLNAGQTRTILYRVDVPDQAQPDKVRFFGQAFSGVPSMQTDVRGDKVVDVVLALPVKVAVSRLTENGTLDLRLSNFITFNQMLQATALWKEQARVPGTDGRRIDLSTMVTLVAYWRTGTPIDQRLPDDAR
ncbi:MAG: PKD domain-containing protein [Candidatus Bipolaricaulia bacterium]